MFTVPSWFGALTVTVRESPAVVLLAAVTSRGSGQAPSFYPDLTAKLVEWGITSVSVSPDMIERTREIIGEIEERRGVLPSQG